MTAIHQWLSSVRDVARIDCEVLLGKVLTLSRAQILARPERLLSPAEQARLQTGITALRDGTPLAYLLGNREFWGLSFSVNPAVLIPRPETELLVELTIELAPRNGRVLDLGTGSGAIAIAVAAERADLHVTAVDNSSAALEVARQNAATHEVSIEFMHSDWFCALSAQWHLVVTNPPYIAADDPHLADLQAEPAQALVAKNEGLGDIRRIISASHGHLYRGGHLLIEHGYNQACAVRQDMQAAGFTDVHSARDLSAIERATVGRRDG